MRQLRVASLFLILTCICSASIGFTCKEAERKALLEFKHSFIDEWNRLGSWVGQDCCNWKGVGCDNVTGNVVKLDLRGNPYPIMSQSYLRAGEVNPALLELKYLKYLDLSGNDFNASRIPKFLGSMSQLQHLNLSSSSFGGEVPPHLGNLTKLVVLDLCTSCLLWEDIKSRYWESDLAGEIWGATTYQEVERNNLEWAFKLENLQYLDLSGIDLSQSLDALDLLHKLLSLSVLNLADCGLGNSHLPMRNSTISSSTLQRLDLHLNNFHGLIPHFIQNLSSIRFLDLSLNHFNSSIPSWLGSKVNLRSLSLAVNNLNGPFPHFIENSSFLTSLDLSYNQFSSSIPLWLAGKRYLEYLSLSNNHFDHVDGGIMNTIGNLCSLKYMDLSNNQLQEEVSEPLVNFSRCSRYDLEYLLMKNNNISGYLPIIGSLTSLLVLDLSNNTLEGLPSSLGGLSSLEILYLSHNNLSVVHQVSFANLSSLQYLDISSNSPIIHFSPDWMPPFQLQSMSVLPCKLNSLFPKWVLSQKKISGLDLSNTGIFGPLPENIGIAMPSLSVLRLANNDINGSIPRSLCEVAPLYDLHLQNNKLSGMIPDCWANSQIEAMDLSSNKLSGPIPNSLTKVATLYFLSMSNNSIGGELPLSLSNSPLLTFVDLSRNNLHGEIPPWNGANFPSFQILMLGQNKLEGKIPPQLCSIQTLTL